MKIKLSETKSIDLSKDQRYALLKLIFASTSIDIADKMEYLEKEKSRNFSDSDVVQELGCLAALPDDKSKFELWDRYV